MKDIIKSISKGVLKLLTKFFNLTDLNPEFNSSQGVKLLIKLLLIKTDFPEKPSTAVQDRKIENPQTSPQ